MDEMKLAKCPDCREEINALKAPVLGKTDVGDMIYQCRNCNCPVVWNVPIGHGKPCHWMKVHHSQISQIETK